MTAPTPLPPPSAEPPALAAASLDGAAGRDPRLAAFTRLAWANQAWLTPMAAVLTGPWLLAAATAAVGDRGTVLDFGFWHLRADAYPSFMVAVAALLQFFVLPVVGAHADGGPGHRRRWLVWSLAAGAACCGLFAVTGGGAWPAAGILYLFGNLVMGAVDLVYNGTLPELAAPAERDAVSSRGIAWGYLGGGALLAVDLVLLQVHSALGLSESGMVRVCFVASGLWWLGFGLPAARGLAPRTARIAGTARMAGTARAAGTAQTEQIGQTGSGQTGSATGMSLRHTLGALAGAWRTLGRMPQARRYLIAYLLFSDAVTGVAALAATYLTHELFGGDSDKATPFLFELVLMIQFAAVFGAWSFAALTKRIGARTALLLTLVLWCAVVLYGWAWMHTTTEAVGMGVAVGIGLGSNISLSRSLFAQMVPVGREATFFSLYEVAGNGTAWLAPLVFTVVVNATGSFRQALLSLMALFVAGFVLLLCTDVDEASREARLVDAEG
jgi:MFS transporter, UMF1 family